MHVWSAPHSILPLLSTPELFLALCSLSGARKLGGTAVSRLPTDSDSPTPPVRPSVRVRVRPLLSPPLESFYRKRAADKKRRQQFEKGERAALLSLVCWRSKGGREGGNEIVKSRCGGMNERTKESKSETRCRRPNRNNQYQFQPSIDLSGVLISICITLSLLQAFSSSTSAGRGRRTWGRCSTPLESPPITSGDRRGE